MLTPKKINFFYFSGTGNTFLVVKEMVKFFKESGYEVHLKKMEKHKTVELEENAVLGLGFTVAFQSTFGFVWDFLKNLPDTDKCTKVFMVDTMSEYSSGIVGPLKKLLLKKGYKPIGEKEIRMPSNLTGKINHDIIEKKIAKGLKDAKKYAHDIVYESSHWTKMPLPNVLDKISQSPRVLKFFRKFYPMSVDEGKCIKCELCVKLCPVDNIVMEEYPQHLDKCEYCMRCFAFCPTNAIKIKRANFKQYKSINANELL